MINTFRPFFSKLNIFFLVLFMNILFISGYAGWGEKFALIGDKLINKNEINKYDVITQGLDSYENLKNMEMKEIILFLKTPISNS